MQQQQDGLCQAVDTVTQRNKPLKEYYSSVKNRNGPGKYVRVSTMRKLIRMIYTMLRKRREWKYENTALTESKHSRLDDD